MSRARAVQLAWLALLVTLLVPVWWGADFSASWDVDAIAPGSVLKAMVARFGFAWHSSYGPVPYYLTAAAYVPLLTAMKLAGELGRPSPVYPWGFAHPGASMLALVLTARFVTLLLALGVAWLASRDARRCGDGDRVAWVPVLLLGSAVFAYYARTSNVDLHTLFWLWLAFHLVEDPEARTRRLAFGAAAATIAVCCKEQVAPLSVVAIAWAMLRAWSSRGHGGAGVRSALGVALVSVVAYALVWRLPFGFPGWLGHHRFIFTDARYARTYPLTPTGLVALVARIAQLLPLALGTATLALTALAILLRVSWRGLGARAIGCALYLGVFIVPIGYVYPRFLLPLLLPALPLSLRAIGAVAVRLRGRPAPARALAVVVVGLTLFGGPALSVAMLTDPRLAAERWVRAHLTPGEQLELTGSPHFQSRAPAGARVIWTRAESLRVSPRGPRGDLVLASSLTVHDFLRDSTVRRSYWDSLVAGPPNGRYRKVVTFHGPPALRCVNGLPVAPTISVFERVH